MLCHVGARARLGGRPAIGEQVAVGILGAGVQRDLGAGRDRLVTLGSDLGRLILTVSVRELVARKRLVEAASEVDLV